MNEKIKIKISENAFEKLLNMLNSQDEYSYLRFTFKDGCCKSPKVDITLDNRKTNDITDNIENLHIVYDMQIFEKIKEITLVYRNASFMIKTILNEMSKKNCANCKATCNKNLCKAN